MPESPEARAHRKAHMREYRKKNKARTDVAERRFEYRVLWHAKRVALVCTSCNRKGMPVEFHPGTAQCKSCCLRIEREHALQVREDFHNLIAPLLEAMRNSIPGRHARTIVIPPVAEKPAIQWGQRGSLTDEKEYQRAYHIANKARFAALAALRRRQNPEHYKKQQSLASERRLNKLREEQFEAYGRYCQCCGEAWDGFLTLEHLKQDGAEHRRRLASPESKSGRVGTYTILLDLRRRGWPKDEATTMCQNCNGARYYRGVCIHEIRRSQAQKFLRPESRPSPRAWSLI